MTLAAALVAAVPAAFANHTTAGVLGDVKEGHEGGLFTAPADVAVNQSTGQIYVVDGKRIQRFGSDLSFQRAFGKGVVAAGGSGDVPGTNQVQTVTAVGTGGSFSLSTGFNTDPGLVASFHLSFTVNATGGSFTLDIEVGGSTSLGGFSLPTAPISFDASPAEVEAAIEAVPIVGPGNVEVSCQAGVSCPGGPWDIAIAAGHMARIAGGGQELLSVEPGNDAGLTGASASLVSRRGEFTDPIPRNASAPQVQGALEALDTIGAGNVLVTGPAGGPWAVEFTGEHADASMSRLGADDSGLTGSPKSVSVQTTTEAETHFEICTVAAQCRRGVAGDEPGELDFFGSDPSTLAIDEATGNLYLADGNNRVVVYDADGNFLRLFGADVVEPGGTGDAPGNETVRLFFHHTSQPIAGTFQLSFSGETTAALPYNASATQIQAALEALPSVDPGDLLVSGPAGGTWMIEFAGKYANSDAPGISVAENKTENAIGNPGNLVLEPAAAPGGFDICTVAAECQVGAEGDGAGQLGGHGFFNVPVPVAFGGPNGRLFVGDKFNSRVSEHAADGTFLRSWGWGVDTEAAQFEICTAASKCRRGVRVTDSQAPVANGHFSTDSSLNAKRTEPGEIVVDAAGTVYASNRDHGKPHPKPGFSDLRPSRLERFDSTAASAAQLLLPNPIHSQEPPEGIPPGPLGQEIAGLEVIPGSGNLLYAHVRAYDGDSPPGIQEIDPAGPSEAHVRLGDPDAFMAGIGYQESGDRLFVSTDNRVAIVASPALPPPLVSIDPPLATGTTVQLSGEVTPNGPPDVRTYYRFEYRPAGTEAWSRVPKGEVPAGDGNAPISVSAEASGLEVATFYEFRLTATREFAAGQATSETLSLLVAAVPPDVVTSAPSSRTDTTAVLAGTVNPRNKPTAYYFEWGAGESGAYEHRVPVPDGTLTPTNKPVRVIEAIEGLSPSSAYHYRLVADNGVEVEPGVTEVAGADVSFTTRATPPPTPTCPNASLRTGPSANLPGCRAYEMVTPPFKVVRAATGFAARVRNNPNVGVPSLSGETVGWEVPFFPLTEDVGYPANNDRRLLRRTAAGWTNETLNTLKLRPESLAGYVRLDTLASSGDLELQTSKAHAGMAAAGAILPTEGAVSNRYYTFRKGTGVEGYTPWLTNPEKQVVDLGVPLDRYGNDQDSDLATINDDGTALVRWGPFGGLAEDYSTAADEDPSDNQPLGGPMIYAQRSDDPLATPNAPKDLVNECTGKTAGSATLLPSRNGSGVATDTIGTLGCQEGSLVSAQGATVGGGVQADGGGERMLGPAATAVSNDGSRVFFQSPSAKTGPTACTTATGAATSCPPQLFVRQYKPSGEAIVRWISRSRSVAGPDNTWSGARIAGQRIALMGAGTGFQAASRDGRYVYFKTNAPLVPNDPNGGLSITTGTASDGSWDLYRYELPSDLADNPDTGSLLRISGGPSGTADPNTNPYENGEGGITRFVSDDGERAYFLTGSPIAGADETPPTGGTTTPGTATGAATGTVRNLYLFDGAQTGADRYRFIARIPFSTVGSVGNGVARNVCASFGGKLQANIATRWEEMSQGQGNCFRGTPDGSHVVFTTAGQLSGEDADDSGDVYLYDADRDELVRVSAPEQSGAAPYVCNGDNVFVAPGPGEGCNGDLGRAPSGGLSGAPHGSDETGRGWGGMRYTNLAENPDGTVSVFFESRSELIPEDTNGDYWDVYEWREGELRLISPGDSNHDSWYSGNSLDGEDVFIWTSQRIDPREIDPQDFDLYDARVAGGIPYVAPPTPCDVLALACESAAKPAPPVQTPGTLSSGPSDNFTPKPPRRCAKGKVRRGKRCVARKASKQRRKAGTQRKGARR